MPYHLHGKRAFSLTSCLILKDKPASTKINFSRKEKRKKERNTDVQNAPSQYLYSWSSFLCYGERKLGQKSGFGLMCVLRLSDQADRLFLHILFQAKVNWESNFACALGLNGIWEPTLSISVDLEMQRRKGSIQVVNIALKNNYNSTVFPWFSSLSKVLKFSGNFLRFRLISDLLPPSMHTTNNISFWGISRMSKLSVSLKFLREETWLHKTTRTKVDCNLFQFVKILNPLKKKSMMSLNERKRRKEKTRKRERERERERGKENFSQSTRKKPDTLVIYRSAVAIESHSRLPLNIVFATFQTKNNKFLKF